MSLIFAFSFCFFLIKLIEKLLYGNQNPTNLKIIKLVNYYVQTNHTLSAIGLFFICFQIFIWNFLLFTTNTIKTNKVVVSFII